MPVAGLSVSSPAISSAGSSPWIRFFALKHIRAEQNADLISTTWGLANSCLESHPGGVSTITITEAARHHIRALSGRNLATVYSPSQYSSMVATGISKARPKSP